jgi:hypothetical protein
MSMKMVLKMLNNKLSKLCISLYIFFIIGVSCSISFAQNPDSGSIVVKSPSPACVASFNSETGNGNTGALIVVQDIINPQRLLPFLPESCTVGADGKVVSLHLGYLSYALIRITKFLISFAFYGFGLNIMISGFMYQTNVLQGDSAAIGKLQKNIANSAKGVIIVILAFFFVQTILYIFNLQGLLTEKLFNN